MGGGDLPVTSSTQRVRFGIDLSLPTFILVALVLVALIFMPMGWLFYFSAVDKAGNFTLEHFETLFSDDELLQPLILTLIVAFAVAGICVLVAAPMALFVARTDMPFRNLVRLLVMASFVTPPFLGAVAWEILAAPNSGLINQVYRMVTGLDREARLVNIYSVPGLVVAIACYTFPYVFILVANALDRIPTDLEDASAILGGGRWRTARKITVPLVLPAILAGALVAFLQAMNNFGSPAIIALPAGFHTITTRIWALFQYPPQPGLAAAAAFPLLLITVLLLRTQQAILGRKGYSVVGGKTGAARLLRLGPFKYVAFLLCLAVLLASVILPYIALVLSAFSRRLAISFDPASFSLQHWRFVFEEFSGTGLALKNTLLLGVATATAGTLLTLIVAYMTARRSVPGHRVLGFLATAPLAIPGIVFGVGLFFAYTQPPLVLYGTLGIMFLAFLTTELPIGYQQFQASFRAVHVELEEASRILGAGRLRTLKAITAPLLWTAVLSTWCFIFIAAIRELSAAVLLFTANTKVLSVLIYDLNETGELGAISVLGITMLLVTFAVIGLANALPRRGPAAS